MLGTLKCKKKEERKHITTLTLDISDVVILAGLHPDYAAKTEGQRMAAVMKGRQPPTKAESERKKRTKKKHALGLGQSLLWRRDRPRLKRPFCQKQHVVSEFMLKRMGFLRTKVIRFLSLTKLFFAIIQQHQFKASHHVIRIFLF